VAVDGLVVRFGSLLAVRGISFGVAEGETFGLTGIGLRWTSWWSSGSWPR
jgi:ABC-type branched-subunit amino acid transport system ATPase component